MIILGIESTCDETGVAIVENGQKILANTLATSVSKQAKYGGVVPEVAAREQLRAIIPSLDTALVGVKINNIDAIAVSYGPGLIGSLLIGVETAKSLSVVWKKPLIPVNHLSAHIYASWAERDRIPEFPLIGLVVSGGHTDLLYMRKHGVFNLIGSTLDDAAGEAFDKVARYLGLPYPGGPQIEMQSQRYHARKNGRLFPRSLATSQDYNFSFSGIKTAVVQYCERNLLALDESTVSEISYEFQEAVVESISTKVSKALEKYKPKSLVVGGGVAANSRLRKELQRFATKFKAKCFFPASNLSVDNGVMIATAAFYVGKQSDPLTIQAESGLHF